MLHRLKVCVSKRDNIKMCTGSLTNRIKYRAMIVDGKGDIEWERKIPDEKLGELKVMLDDAAFKKNLPKVIKRIYELAWEQFSDLPRGHHKVNMAVFGDS